MRKRLGMKNRGRRLLKKKRIEEDKGDFVCRFLEIEYSGLQSDYEPSILSYSEE